MTGWNDASGLSVNGQTAGMVELVGGSLRISYDDSGVAVGDPWEIAGEVDISFAGGLPLIVPESGVVS